eukprot:TRINITY_DN4153_c0_g1_i1.p1 TRINITY_DN4153_c0_g1~~TRINITY_DN4153_c0_g1_i1.p1  ORF type:complete len:425 (+),score=108.79 TRINITY_DN4153_c0_g1_i1:36-1277(+)
MSAEELSSAQKQSLQDAISKSYKDQGAFFLNAYWNELGSNAEDMWKYWKKYQDLDRQQHNALPKEKKPETYVENTSLDEFWSHKMLESIGKTLTAMEFRTEFKKIDANFDKRMSFLEFLIWQYQVSIKEMLQRPQGSDGGEIIKAQNLLNEVAAAFTAAQEALDTATVTAERAKHSKEAAVASENAAKASADSAKKKEDSANAAAAAAAADAGKAKCSADEAAKAAGEQQAAVDELRKQEESHAAKTKELEEKAQAGGVQGMKAKNELAQHLSEDPLPLNKAKLSATAAAKKLEKAKHVADESAEAAEKSKQAADKSAAAAREERDKADHAAAAAAKDRVAAEEAAAAAEKDRQAAMAAVDEGHKKLEEAEAYLEEQKRKGSGERKGSFWWMDRELRERKEHMPRSGNAKLLF